MNELEKEYHFWRQVLAKKLLSGELEREGVYALDSKIRRIYAIGYYLGKIDAEKFKEDIKCLESGLRKKNNC